MTHVFRRKIADVFIIGDSITAGAPPGGVGVIDSYGKMVGDTPEFDTRVFGAPGATAWSINLPSWQMFGSGRVPEVLFIDEEISWFEAGALSRMHGYDAACIMLGVNDCRLFGVGVPVSAFKSQLTRLVNAILDRTSVGLVVLVGAYHHRGATPEQVELLEGYRRVSVEIAHSRRSDIRLGPDMSRYIGREHFSHGDAYHCNQLGHAVMAHKLHRRLLRLFRRAW